VSTDFTPRRCPPVDRRGAAAGEGHAAPRVRETHERLPRAGHWSDRIGVVAGLWLVVAPMVLNHGDTDPHWNDTGFGALTAFLALGRATGAFPSAR
jgi:hypothetical protein